MDAEDRGHPPGTRRLPIKWLVITVLLTVTLLFWLGWHVRNSFRVSQEVQALFTLSEQYRDRIIDLAHEITLSARTRAISNELSWQARYEELVEQLTLALHKQPDHFELTEDSQALASAQINQQSLRTMEAMAFTRMRTESREAGLRILTGDNYLEQQRGFAKHIDQFIDEFRQSLHARLRNERNKELGSLVVAFFIFTISLAFWLSLIHRLQNWGNRLFQEIIERRKAEQEAKDSEKKYRNLFEYANDPIFIVNPTTHSLLDANEKASDALGYTHDDLLQFKLEDILAETGAGQDRKVLEILCGEAGGVMECEYRCKDGTVLPVEVSGRLIQYGDTEVYQCFARDITERKRFQDERLQAQKLESLGQLASGVAHDFNNLLTAVSGYTDIAGQLLPEKHPASEPLIRIHQALDQAEGITKALLAFSRKHVPERQLVELSALVEEAVQLFKRVLPATIHVTVETPPQRNCWVMADKTQLQQVLLNLVLNARDAMPNGGALTLVLSKSTARGKQAPTADTRPNHWLALEVRDTGVGMPSEVQARLFEPFFTTKPRGQGTGLGLPTVHGIVTQHGGRVEIRTAPGQGSTFTVLLPAEHDAYQQAQPRPSPRQAAGHGELILLAEDHRYVREIMTATLQTLGYRVVQCADGAALLAAYGAHQPHLELLIVDLDLPERSGLACVQDIRAGGGKLPVILMTGTDTLDLTGQLDDTTVLLRKPFQMATLGQLAAKLMNNATREALVTDD